MVLLIVVDQRDISKEIMGILRDEVTRVID